MLDDKSIKNEDGEVLYVHLCSSCDVWWGGIMQLEGSASCILYMQEWEVEGRRRWKAQHVNLIKQTAHKHREQSRRFLLFMCQRHWSQIRPTYGFKIFMSKLCSNVFKTLECFFMNKAPLKLQYYFDEWLLVR